MTFVSYHIFGDRSAAFYMLFNDLFRFFGIHFHISDLVFSVSKNFNDRLILADTDASGLRNLDLIRKSGVCNFLNKGIENGTRSRGDTAGCPYRQRF